MIIADTMLYGDRLFKLQYEDLESFSHLPLNKCRQSYGVCFYNDQLLIAKGGKYNNWGLVGGTIEVGETIEQTLIREILEESNMNVIANRPIGSQQVTDPEGNVYYQLRSICLVKPKGPFVADPAGSIKEIKLIDPEKYKIYFDWGKIGERIIKRAVELKSTLSNE